MPMLSIGDLPTDNDNPMAKLTRAISTYLAKLDRQRLAIGAKYDAFCDLLVNAQTNFDVSALKQRVHLAVGAHTAPLIELVSNAKAVINVKYDDISTLHCENIRNGYLYDGDLVFVILKGIYGFKFPKRFLEISSRDLTSSFFF
jgi:hypothetical protein